MKVVKYIIISILFLFAFSCNIFAQTDYIQAKKIAIRNIVTLHDSAILIVRLQTKEKTIEAYRKYGDTEAANEEELNQKKLNQQIVNAFIENFDFCKVYFIFSDQSSNLKNRNDVIFLNHNLEEDLSIKPDYTHFYIAEFGLASSETGIHGLFLRDENFEKLTKPFPYYVKNSTFYSKAKSTIKTVTNLDYKLHNYYENK